MLGLLRAAIMLGLVVLTYERLEPSMFMLDMELLSVDVIFGGRNNSVLVFGSFTTKSAFFTITPVGRVMGFDFFGRSFGALAGSTFTSSSSKMLLSSSVGLIAFDLRILNFNGP